MKKIQTMAFLAFFLLQSLVATAQDITLKLNNVSQREVIEEIQKSYGYSFSIRTSAVDVSRKISISVKNADIKDVLDKVFAGDNVTCKIDGKIISVTEKVLPKQENAKPSTFTVVGTVNDNLGEPVAGASVVIKGTNTGTLTDIDGNFSMKVTGNPVLVVSFLTLLSK